MGVAERVLSEGDAHERAALELLANNLIAARTALSAPTPDLPGFGPKPDPGALAGALARNAQRLWQARQELYDRAIDHPTAADLLGVSDREVSNLVAAGKLLTLDGPDGERLPA